MSKQDQPTAMHGASMNISLQRKRELGNLFPGIFTETRNDAGELVGTIDFERLKAELGQFSEIYDNRRERYGMDWPGKRDSLRLIQAPSHATLKPCREESVDFDTTENLFIEGDNLEVLKLLQKSYYGQVKMIYIDPPYNTGKEFIYPDNFSENLDTYLQYAGLKDSQGRTFSTNTANEGRFHTKWLNMMFPRLYLARNLLTQDGFLVVSIDDAEVENLTLLLNELMGEENHIATLVWDRNRKNDARYFSVGHEYMLVYSRNAAHLSEQGIRLKEPQEGLEDAKKAFAELVAEHGNDWQAVREGWLAWFDNIPLADPRRRLLRYTKVGPRGPFRDDRDISWPGGNGPDYEIRHPATGQPVPVPSRGWVFPTPARFWQEYDAGRVVFGADHSTSARMVSYLFESDGQVMPSVFYSYAQSAAQEFKSLMGARVFDNPKNWRDLHRLVSYLTDEGDTVLDFFAGSASTAHAVMKLPDRKFILVQLPEHCDEKSVAFGEGYATIAEVAKQRLCRAIEVISYEQTQQASFAESTANLGFKVLKLDQSNFKPWQSPDKSISDAELIQQMELSVDHVDPNASQEDLLYELLLKAGVKPTEKVELISLAGHQVFSVGEGSLLVHLENQIDQALIDAVLNQAPSQFICLDKAFHGNDQLKTNAVRTFTNFNDGQVGIDRIDFKTV